jgi:hypothetical protein
MGPRHHPVARCDVGRSIAVCERFADPRHAGAIIRAEVEIALKQLKGWA